MSQTRGPWTVLSQQQVYRNQFLELTEAEVIQPDGEPGAYATVMLKPGVAVLPIHTGRAVLTRQFRYALGADSTEVVSGGIDEDEDPLYAAQRELREELGMEARDWLPMGLLHLDTSIVHCPVHLFIARRCTFQAPQTEGSETIKPLQVPFHQAYDMVLDGAITHAASCSLILRARQIL